MKKTKDIEHLEMNSSQIISLLEKKHEKDLFVAECKNGETWGSSGLLKLDAWVLKRTYSPLTTIGYEIKCSRQDFERDQKWVGYLDLCHEFFFVCPAGLIRSTDLPSRVGLIWCTKEHSHIKKKASYIKPDPEILNPLLIYILMARTKIVANMYETNRNNIADDIAYRLESVKEYDRKKELSYLVKGHIRNIWEDIGNREAKLKENIRRIEDFESRLARLGITWDSKNNNWYDSQKVCNEIALLKKTIDGFTLENMKRTGQQLISTADEIFKLHARDT